MFAFDYVTRADVTRSDALLVLGNIGILCSLLASHLIVGPYCDPS